MCTITELIQIQEKNEKNILYSFRKRVCNKQLTKLLELKNLKTFNNEIMLYTPKKHRASMLISCAKSPFSILVFELKIQKH
jgi:hypothetical protein